MSRGTATGIRTAGMLVLLCVSANVDPLPLWWWAALAVLVFWSVLDYREREDDED